MKVLVEDNRLIFYLFAVRLSLVLRFKLMFDRISSYIYKIKLYAVAQSTATLYLVGRSNFKSPNSTVESTER